MKYTFLGMLVTAFLSFPVAGLAGPLHDMANEGNLEAVKNLLSQGVDANTTDDEGWTALHHAAFVGYTAIVELLLEKGATVDVKDETGNTALYRAVEGGSSQAAKALIVAGAPGRTHDGRDSRFERRQRHDARQSGQYPPARCVAARKKGIAELLLTTHGADVNATIPSGSTTLDIANSNGDTHLADFLTQHGAKSGIPAGIGT